MSGQSREAPGMADPSELARSRTNEKGEYSRCFAKETGAKAQCGARQCPLHLVFGLAFSLQKSPPLFVRAGPG